MKVEQIISLIVGLLSGLGGAWLGVKVSIAVLESLVQVARKEIQTLRDRSHDHTAELLKLDGRVTALEERQDER